MRRVLPVAFVLLCAVMRAQEVERRLGTYKLLTSYEFGYRSAFVSGNRDVYRSAVNYNNGWRLFDGLFRLNSGDGHGIVDEIVLTTFGQGGDPYQANSLRIERNRWFRLDMGFRIVNYFNQLPALSGGEHRLNTERMLQSYDLTLLPLRKVQFIVGFDRNNQNGPAVSSENIDVRGEPAFPRDRFLVFADDVRRVNNQWRAGATTTLGPVRLSFLQGWDFFKDDTRHSAPGLRRSDPVHGMTPFSRFNIHTDANRRFAVNGRFVYAGGERNFVLDENVSALNPASGVLVTRQAFVLGRGERSQGTGDLTMSWQPGERWTFSNTTSVNRTRITGDSAFVEVREPANRLDPNRDEYFFSVLGVRLISNATDVNFRPTNRVGLYGGYHYSIRRLQSREIREDPSGAPTGVPLDTFQNILHSGVAGVRVRPVNSLTLLFDIERGQANRPFAPVSEKRFHAETVKAQWKHKSWLVTGNFQAYRNRNAPPVLSGLEGPAASGHLLKSRQYSTSFAWTPPKQFALDASYAKLHLDSASGILNFPLPDGPSAASRRSLYISNLHHVHGTFRVQLPREVTLFLGYSVVKDTADGRDRPVFVAPFVPSYPNFSFDGTDLINVYPLTYQSPQARLSIRLHRKLSWNAGWQYYGYSEKFTGLQNYHANLALTSLRWSF